MRRASMIILATLLALASASAFAYCYTHTIMTPNGVIVCQTCCYSGNCTTTCF